MESRRASLTANDNVRQNQRCNEPHEWQTRISIQTPTHKMPQSQSTTVRNSRATTSKHQNKKSKHTREWLCSSPGARGTRGACACAARGAGGHLHCHLLPRCAVDGSSNLPTRPVPNHLSHVVQVLHETRRRQKARRVVASCSR